SSIRCRIYAFLTIAYALNRYGHCYLQVGLNLSGPIRGGIFRETARSGQKYSDEGAVVINGDQCVVRIGRFRPISGFACTSLYIPCLSCPTTRKQVKRDRGRNDVLCRTMCAAADIQQKYECTSECQFREQWGERHGGIKPYTPGLPED